MEKMPILIPTNEVLERFDQVVRPMLERIMSSHHEQTLLAESRDLLLPRLMSGQVSVAEAERELEAAA